MQAHLQKIDPTLHFRRRLLPSSVLVYQVERDGSSFVLKVAEDAWDRKHLRNEERTLSLCSDVNGITHLVQAYRPTPSSYPRAILKEYMEGKSPQLGHRFSNSQLQSTLEKTVEELHYRRISDLELEYKNIVISRDGTQLRIVDLGNGSIYPKTEENAFRRAKDVDYRKMEWIFK